jgi:hypothetical protein
VERLRLQVDTSKTSIDHLGTLVPSLHSLDLAHSRVESIRDLGTSLAHLMLLNLSSWCVLHRMRTRLARHIPV